MSKLFQNKSLLKSVRVFLVCLVVLGGGLLGNNKANADCTVTGSYDHVDFDGNYSYSRVNENVSIGYYGGESYTVTDSDVTVLYSEPSTSTTDCASNPCGLLTLLRENTTGEYYFLIGEDDFMPDGKVGVDSCTVVCQAFRDDFIPIISANLIGGAIGYSAISRIGDEFTGHSIITADNGVNEVHFIFSDSMTGFLTTKGWDYVFLGGVSAVSLTSSIDICDIISSSPSPPPSPPPPTECKPGLVPCGRICDVSSTPYREDQPCTICHLVLMMQLIMDFLFKIAAVVAAFFIAASGTMYIVSAGRPELLSLSKTTFKTTLLGFILVFIAWVLVNTILTMFGYIDPLRDGNWHIIC